LVGFDPLPNATCTPQTHASVAQVVVKVTHHVLVDAASLLIVKLPHVGAVVSLRIVYVFEFVGPHQVSLILIITLVVHSLGVNVNERLVLFVVQLLHELVEYETNVLGDGVAVSVIVQVIDHA
jgi:hypothetical protein